MADTKISALTAYGTEHGDDLLAVVDVHDTSMAASGTDKAATVYKVFGSPSATGQLVYWNGTSTGVPAGAASLTVGASGQLNLASIAAPGSPAIGDEWYDSTQACGAMRAGPGGLTVFRQALAFSQVTNVSVTATGATTLVSTTGATGGVSLPAGFLNVTGRVVRVRARGYYSTAAASQGTVALLAKLGATSVATTNTMSFVASTANRTWTLEFDLTVKATGVSGGLDTQGYALLWNTGTNLGITSQVQNTGGPTSAVSLDLTAAYTLDIQVNMSATGNTFVCTNLTAEVLG